MDTLHNWHINIMRRLIRNNIVESGPNAEGEIRQNPSSSAKLRTNRSVSLRCAAWDDRTPTRSKRVALSSA